jgi:hypothetical protein
MTGAAAGALRRSLLVSPIAAILLFAWNIITSMMGWWIFLNPAPA